MLIQNAQRMLSLDGNDSFSHLYLEEYLSTIIHYLF